MAPKSKLDPAKAQAALERRLAAAPEFTDEAVAGNFPEQLAYLKCRDRRVAGICSRRAGKSFANAKILISTAQATANVSCLLIGLTLNQVRRSAWKAAKTLLRKFKIPTLKVSDSDMTIELPNGSTIYFGSMSDVGTVEAYLGDSYASGVVILDEIQSVPLRVIEPLIEDIIEPCLDDMTPEKPIPGRLIVSGTFRTASGYLWDVWTGDEFTKFNWNRLQNPHLIGQKAEFDRKVAKKGLTPRLARDYLGIPKFDSTATAFRYDPKKNAYTPKPATWACNIGPGKMMATDMPADCDTVHAGVDPGASDRFSVVWWYSHSRRPTGLRHGGEWVTDRNANAGWNHAGQVLDLIDANVRGGITHLFYDGQGSKVSLDLFSKTVGRRALLPANKSDLFGRVERMASLFESGEAQVIAGSQLERDYMLASWDPDARAEGKYKWSSTGGHPDPAMASMYGLDQWWQVHDSQQTTKSPKSVAELEEEAWLQAQRVNSAAASYGPPPDLASEGSGYGPSTDY